MAIMTRILRLWKADIHGVMDQLEDKELLLKQYLREMESSLDEKENRLKSITASLKRIENTHNQCEQEIEKLEEDLKLALRKENDEIARLLIRKQRSQQIYLQEMQRQQHNLEQDRTSLIDSLKEQRLQYETMRAKTEAYCRDAEMRKQNDSFSSAHDSFGDRGIDDNEIELELMRRKEAMSGEGAYE